MQEPVVTSPICPDTLLPAECCDADESCYNGNDDWCCDDIFYCSNDGVDYAESMDGISCPVETDIVIDSLACSLIDIPEAVVCTDVIYSSSLHAGDDIYSWVDTIMYTSTTLDTKGELLVLS